jgi:hypothetical protein
VTFNIEYRLSFIKISLLKLSNNVIIFVPISPHIIHARIVLRRGQTGQPHREPTYKVRCDITEIIRKMVMVKSSSHAIKNISEK